MFGCLSASPIFARKIMVGLCSHPCDTRFRLSAAAVVRSGRRSGVSLEEFRKLVWHKVPKVLDQAPHFAHGDVGPCAPEALGGCPVYLLQIGGAFGRPGPACIIERPKEFGEGAIMSCGNI